MSTLPKGTKEMIRFAAELNGKNNTNNAKRDRILGEINKKRDEIAEALVGIGCALKSLTEKKEELDKKYEETKKELAWVDPNIEFMSKFGVNMYQVNLYTPPTQEEIDAIEAKEDEED